jgi:hypothetical protein
MKIFEMVLPEFEKRNGKNSETKRIEKKVSKK